MKKTYFYASYQARIGKARIQRSNQNRPTYQKMTRDEFDSLVAELKAAGHSVEDSASRPC